MSNELLPRALAVILVLTGTVLVTRPAASGTPTSASSGQPVTTTLLPEVADRMLREQRVAPLPYAKLTSTKNHPGDTHDCLTCHGESKGDKAPLPQDHAQGKTRTPWAVESCERCHQREAALGNRQTTATSTSLADNGYCTSCHGDANLKREFLGTGESVSLYVDREPFAASVHGQQRMPCVGCHAQRRFPHENIAHRTSRELARSIERESCWVCHPKQVDQFRKSVHGGKHMGENSRDTPGCIDCHGSHAVMKVKTSDFRMGMLDTCARCHSDPKIAARYALSANAAAQYREEFHGASVRLARNQGPHVTSNKPVCHECHGAHDITKANAPNSRVSKARLVAVCRNCHKNAGEKFAGAWMGHSTPTLKQSPIVYLTQLSYKLLIPAVMGQFGLYMLFDVLRNLLNRIRGGKRR